jgi:hypothetical protein
VLGHHRTVREGTEVRERGVVVDRGDVGVVDDVHRGERVDRVRLPVEHQLPGEGDVIGRELLAVVPGDVVTQGERELLARFVELPLGRQVRFDRAGLGAVQADERFVHERRSRGDRGRRRGEDVEVPRPGGAVPAGDAHLGGLVLRTGGTLVETATGQGDAATDGGQGPCDQGASSNGHVVSFVWGREAADGWSRVNGSGA